MSAVLEAKDAIRELMAAYAMALDACRFADVAACFAPDGVKGEGPQRKHYITNIIIKVDGDTASAVSDYLVVRESANGLLPVMGGTYRDQFVKTAAGWRFSRKELEHHIWGDMALKNGR
jgi:hypothetical protein